MPFLWRSRIRSAAPGRRDVVTMYSLPTALRFAGTGLVAGCCQGGFPTTGRSHHRRPAWGWISGLGRPGRPGGQPQRPTYPRGSLKLVASTDRILHTIWITGLSDVFPPACRSSRGVPIKLDVSVSAAQWVLLASGTAAVVTGADPGAEVI